MIGDQMFTHRLPFPKVVLRRHVSEESPGRRCENRPANRREYAALALIQSLDFSPYLDFDEEAGTWSPRMEKLVRAQLEEIGEAFIEEGGAQCGICTPGMIVSATALLADNPSPSEAEIRHHLEGNICRCTGYHNIVRAIQAAADPDNALEEGQEAAHV